MKTGFQNSIKKSAENRHPFYEILGPFWGPFGSGHAVLSPLFYKCVLHVGTREAGYMKMGPKIDEVWVLKSMISVDFFDRFLADFMFNFVFWPGRPDKRRTHTEHTHRAHTEQLSPRFPFLCQDRFLAFWIHGRPIPSSHKS